MEKRDLAKAFLCGAFSWGFLSVAEPKFEPVDANLKIKKVNSVFKTQSEFVGECFDDVGKALILSMEKEHV